MRWLHGSVCVTLPDYSESERLLNLCGWQCPCKIATRRSLKETRHAAFSHVRGSRASVVFGMGKSHLRGLACSFARQKSPRLNSNDDHIHCSRSCLIRDPSDFHAWKENVRWCLCLDATPHVWMLLVHDLTRKSHQRYIFSSVGFSLSFRSFKKKNRFQPQDEISLK